MLRFLLRSPLILATLVVGVAVVICAASGLELAARIIATVFVGAFVLWTVVGMVRDMLRGHFGLDILAVIAMVATLAVGEYIAAVVVMLMLTGGEALEDYAQRRARRDLGALLERAPRIAHRIEGDGVREVPVAEIAVGEEILIRPAELVPVDGVLLSDVADLDESQLTGESLPVTRSAGAEIASGTINGTVAVRMRAVRTEADSQYQQIVALVRAAEASKAPTVRMADRFAIPFTAVSLIIAGIAWALSDDPVRFAEVLVLATPCPLLLAAPVAFLGGLSQTAKRGVVVKGGAVLERLAQVRSAAFDKTGTLTQGRPTLMAVRARAGFSENEVLALAAAVETASSHVLAAGIISAAADRGLTVDTAERAVEVATNGIIGVVRGRTVAVGKPAYIASIVPDTARFEAASGEAVVYVAVDGRFAGTLVLTDEVRPDAAETVAALHRLGVTRTAILTGDVEPTARSVAEKVGIAEVHAELLPADKVRLAADMQPRPVLMVGDGVNDAPVLAAVDVGIAMGVRGSTAAGEAASAVVLRDAISPVVSAIAISRHTVSVAKTSIWIGIALSVALMLVATTGVIPAVAGALTQELIDLAAILYALRALRAPRGI
ncbi:Lead, cadmium, zinc and mercury transporting ATPase; Copper-translocating P-type ATPase [Microbacterium esteraromaticum]|uniref:Lead, cadmium, zinc and mercury transporting ATPase Copper-translocating P-type ATPase n=1 Tax=Microbacterium esteraromaticum TaxID=57043 RepID=A0A1R4IBT8_9MICO|nr:Lead, cadmium, zinc and mercury transporting ATPase; Copper-translocating P-type ATPase [Microbacterium esteraromaticum]